MTTTLRLCTVCGDEFETRIPHQMICSAECRRQKQIAYQIDYQKNKREVHTLQCVVCSTPFHSPDKNRKLCGNPSCRGKKAAANARSGLKTASRRKLLDSKLSENDEL